VFIIDLFSKLSICDTWAITCKLEISREDRWRRKAEDEEITN